jgi:hypothetical protein
MITRATDGPLGRARLGLLAYPAFLGHAQLAHATPDLLPKGQAFGTRVGRVVEALVRVDG